MSGVGSGGESRQGTAVNPLAPWADYLVAQLSAPFLTRPCG
jgi:hypothetical protein